MNLYGVTASVVKATRLASLQTIDDTAMGFAIVEVANEVNELLRGWGIDSDAITQADYYEDYTLLGSIVATGAAASYVSNSSGAPSPDLTSRFTRWLGQLQKQPATLRIYSVSRGSNTAGSHVSLETAGETERNRLRLLNPDFFSQWQST